LINHFVNETKKRVPEAKKAYAAISTPRMPDSPELDHPKQAPERAQVLSQVISDTNSARRMPLPMGVDGMDVLHLVRSDMPNHAS
jgi:hypothetical protein